MAKKGSANATKKASSKEGPKVAFPPRAVSDGCECGVVGWWASLAMQASGGGALALEPSESALAIGVKVPYLVSDTQLSLSENLSFYRKKEMVVLTHVR